jgi:hypothetical protein
MLRHPESRAITATRHPTTSDLIGAPEYSNRTFRIVHPASGRRDYASRRRADSALAGISGIVSFLLSDMREIAAAPALGHRSIYLPCGPIQLADGPLEQRFHLIS